MKSTKENRKDQPKYSTKQVYPLNLVAAILGSYEDAFRFAIADFPKAIEEYDRLDDVQKKVIDLRFKEAWTLKEVGAEIGVSKERVRQIEAKTLRILRNPCFLSKLRLVNYTGLKDFISRHFEESNKFLNEIAKQIKSIDYDHYYIEQINFSTRTYNCLRRAGILTVKQLSQMSEDDLAHVRNLGKKCVKEIKERMEEIGVHMK